MVKTVNTATSSGKNDKQGVTSFSKFKWEDGGEYEGEWLNGDDFEPYAHRFLKIDSDLRSFWQAKCMDKVFSLYECKTADRELSCATQAHTRKRTGAATTANGRTDRCPAKGSSSLQRETGASLPPSRRRRGAPTPDSRSGAETCTFGHAHT